MTLRILILIPVLVLGVVQAQENDTAAPNPQDYDYATYKKLIEAARKKEQHKGEIINTEKMHDIFPEEVPEQKRQEIDDSAKAKAVDQLATPAEDDTTTPVEQPQTAIAPKSVKVDPKPAPAEVTTAEPKAAPAPKKSAPSPAKEMNNDYYFPPSARAGKVRSANIVSSTSKEQPRAKFGIRIGTEFDVKLPKNANNIQPGLIKLIVQQDVIGDIRVMPAGTELFGSPSVSKGSNHLYITLLRGVTPDGTEFKINGYVYSTAGKPGLAGIIKSDGKIIDRSLVEGGLALGSNLLSAAAGDGVVSTAVDAAAGTALDEGQDIARQRAGQSIMIVEAQPQKGIVVVGETF